MGRTLIIKNIDPTMVNGMDAIPAAMTPRTILNEASFPIGPHQMIVHKFKQFIIT